MAGSIVEELKWRGAVHDLTPELDDGSVGSEPMVAYCGFDPTSDSLHLGNLIPIIGLVRLQRFGHPPIALVGGATGLIGDPSGKATERQLLDADQLALNIAGIRTQLERYLDFSGSCAATMVNNADWLSDVGFIPFLRDVGKHFRVNQMLGKESVRSRIQESGMSFTEFSYMLLQAADFLHLYDEHKCVLQVGGADQWGNITAGIELVRRVRSGQVHGLTYPLLTSASGAKFGKSEAGALWLDVDRTSPYEIYQYLMASDDQDVVRYLKLFTFLERDRIDELAAIHAERPGAREAHQVLAWEVTAFVHGEAEADKAVRASQVLFGAPLDGLDETQILSIFADVPSTEVGKDQLTGEGWGAVDALVETGLAKSRGDARRRIEGGGVYVNNVRLEAADAHLGADDLASQNTLILRSGKRNYHLVRFV